MPKAKSAKGGVAPKHLHARISFLFQASNYFSSIASSGHIAPIPSPLPNEQDNVSTRSPGDLIPHEKVRSEKAEAQDGSFRATGLSRHMSSQLRAVSLKSQIRLSTDVKHSICKRCDAVLIPGKSSTEHIQNSSKNGAKPWADVLVVTCNACGMERRYPTGMQRQARKPARLKQRPQAVHTTE